MVRNSATWAEFSAAHQLIRQEQPEPGTAVTYASVYHGIKMTATYTTKPSTTGHLITLQLFAPGAQSPREMMVMYTAD
ncbi:hypothetical protein ASE39_21605 [Acidovorax sp. Root267]|nr:hypothetical protein ASE39_21605 [Acidovorax sp. Root267]